jgi:hypothetical protein
VGLEVAEGSVEGRGRLIGGGVVGRGVVGGLGGMGRRMIGRGGVGGLGGMGRERLGGLERDGGGGRVPGRETARRRVRRWVQERAPADCSCCTASQNRPSKSTKVRARTSGREEFGSTKSR